MSELPNCIADLQARAETAERLLAEVMEKTRYKASGSIEAVTAAGATVPHETIAANGRR